MEKWEIALGMDFAKFKEAIGRNVGALSKKGEAFSKLVGGYLFEKPVPWPPPEADSIAVKTEGQEFLTKSFDIGMNIWDLRVAAQNRLLGGLFTYKIPTRKPGDPKVEVLRLPEDEEREAKG